jgi:murein DD-endopeptidase MepM/ murein hydrolase activator NlpD
MSDKQEETGRSVRAGFFEKLPDWHVELRSETRAVSVRIGQGTQIMGLSMAILVAGFVGLGATTAADREAREDAVTSREMARMAAQVEALKVDSAALKGQVLTTAERIEARQRFLDALLAGKARGPELVGLLPPAGRARLSGQAAEVAGVLAPFAALEAKQLALVDKASATAETRLRDADTILRRLGLNQSRFIAQSSPRMALGGPFVPARGETAASGTGTPGPDPRFAELYVNWQRVAQLEEAMAAIPAFMPVENATATSGYGFRYDPFSGRGAMHAGIDLAGRHGETVRASAAGRVVRAERFGAYGLAVDVDHGHGIMTRYAHLSRIDVAPGDQVSVGERIGGMGSTGRSTGTHLHFEIRIDGQAVNPRPYLDASAYVLAMRDRAGPEVAGSR